MEEQKGFLTEKIKLQRANEMQNDFEFNFSFEMFMKKIFKIDEKTKKKISAATFTQLIISLAFH